MLMVPPPVVELLVWVFWVLTMCMFHHPLMGRGEPHPARGRVSEALASSNRFLLLYEKVGLTAERVVVGFDPITVGRVADEDDDANDDDGAGDDIEDEMLPVIASDPAVLFGCRPC